MALASGARPTIQTRVDRTVRVLIIDDEEMIRSLAVRVLNRAGIEVCTAESGTQGLAQASSDPTIDVAIVDMTLPDIEGLELIRRIHQQRPELKCVLSTGQALTDRDIPAELAGTVSLLPKPYRSQALVETVLQLSGQGAKETPSPR